ncbi:LON peptidase substrate-binding domain-containing protein [Pelagibacterium xiamenense]|uniref:LON peptidase substrate-binding domain-containing protein n=1 Tax=Pelagibacterium xiamenense TaxID=2901140 RepID=UPI001E3DFC21|nr:LON peptidase substrate-binding domain-containing protein [Pelagibacterium xiamenense]MCD7058406.1 LON peptidase substrate-binding domain-containing protein [Pelagibacterium xiamenense]
MRRPHSTSDLPELLALFPLSKALLLPGAQRPLNIFEPRFVEMIDDALAGNRLIGLIQPTERTNEEAPRGPVGIEEVGCIGRIVHFEEQEENRYFVVLEGVSRFDLVEEVTTATPYRQARISTARYDNDFTPELGVDRIDRARLLAVLREYAEFSGIDVDWEEVEQTDTGQLVNLGAMLSPYGAKEKQALLEAPTQFERAETLIALAEMEMARARQGAVLQ